MAAFGFGKGGGCTRCVIFPVVEVRLGLEIDFQFAVEEIPTTCNESPTHNDKPKRIGTPLSSTAPLPNTNLKPLAALPNTNLKPFTAPPNTEP